MPGKGAIGDAGRRRNSERNRAFAAGAQPKHNQDAVPDAAWAQSWKQPGVQVCDWPEPDTITVRTRTQSH
eukprot:4953749-Alexandrium_andersonii.AAC.1